MLASINKSLIWVVICCFIGIPYAISADLGINGSLSQVSGYDTNFKLAATPSAIYQFFLTPTLNMYRKDDDSTLQSTVSYGFKEYSQSAYNNSPENFSGLGQYKTQHFIWGINSSYSKQLNNSIAATDTGNFTSTSTNISESLGPSLSYLIDAKNTLSWSGSYLSSKYSTQSSSRSSLTDNVTNSTNLSWKYIWSKRFSQSITGSFSQSDFKSTVERLTDTYNLSFGLNYQLSQSWNANGNFGERRTQQSYVHSPAPGSTSYGWTGSLGIGYTGNIHSLGLDMSRSTTPSGLGVLSQQTSFSANYGYKYDDRWTASLNSSYSIYDSIGQQNQIVGSTSTNRKYLSFQPTLNWQMDRELRVSISYLYRNQDSYYIASSNSLMLNFNYNWSGLNLLR